MLEQSSSLGWLLQSPFHEQVQLIYNVGCVGVVWVFLPLLCVLLCINFFRFHLPTPSPFLGAFEDSHSSLWTWVKYAYTYIYAYLYVCTYVYIYGGGGGVMGFFSQTVKEFTKPCISCHATVWHPTGKLILLKIDHLFFLLVFQFWAIFKAATSLNYWSLSFLAILLWGLDQAATIWTIHETVLHRVLLDGYPQISCSWRQMPLADGSLSFQI